MKPLTLKALQEDFRQTLESIPTYSIVLPDYMRNSVIAMMEGMTTK